MSVVQAPVGFCPVKGCGVRSRGPCQTHQRTDQRAKDARRGSARARGYDAKWDAYSRDWRSRFTFCGQRQDGQFSAEHSRCVQAGNFLALAEVVDHIVPLSRGGSMWDPSNHMSLCRACNSAKGDR